MPVVMIVVIITIVYIFCNSDCGSRLFFSFLALLLVEQTYFMHKQKYILF